MEQDRDLEPSLASFIAMVNPGDRKRVEKALQQAEKGRREYNAEFRIITRSKKIKHIVSRGRVFYNLGNEVLSGIAGKNRLSRTTHGHARVDRQFCNQDECN